MGNTHVKVLEGRKLNPDKTPSFNNNGISCFQNTMLIFACFGSGLA